MFIGFVCSAEAYLECLFGMIIWCWWFVSGCWWSMGVFWLNRLSVGELCIGQCVLWRVGGGNLGVETSCGNLIVGICCGNLVVETCVETFLFT